MSGAAAPAATDPATARERPDRWADGPPWYARVLRKASLPALLVIWEVYGRTTSDLLFPPASTVAESLWKLIVNGELARALILSNQSLIIGTTAALLTGIPVGIMLGRSKLLNKIFGIYIDIDLATPSIALLPLIILVFGLGLTARSVVVWSFSFSLIVAIVRTGAQTVDARIIEMARAFAPTTPQLWRKVLIPGMLPALAGAIRIAVSRGVVGMIIVELTLIPVGLGGMVMEARSLFRSSVVFAGVIVICVEGLLLILLARKVEHKIAPRGLYGTG